LRAKYEKCTVHERTTLEVCRVKWGEPSGHTLSVGLERSSLDDEEGSKNSDYKRELHDGGVMMKADENPGSVHQEVQKKKGTSGLLYTGSTRRHKTLRPTATD